MVHSPTPWRVDPKFPSDVLDANCGGSTYLMSEAEDIFKEATDGQDAG
jgi:hypothetical protein